MAGFTNRDAVYQSSLGENSGNNTEEYCPPFEEESKEQLLNLLQTVESNIIPRLVETHRKIEAETAESSGSAISLDDKIEQFSMLLIQQDFIKISNYVNSLRDAGVSAETLYLELFTPAAHRLGVMWEEDECSFTDVTIGVGRLQELLREISASVRYNNPDQEQDKRILLTPIPGEQHTFGLSVLTEFFNRGGWEVWGWPGVSDQNLFQLIKNEWFHIVGISMYAEMHREQLISTINAIRTSSRNPSVNIMVGGHAFATNPELISAVGADAFANDASQALHQAEQLLDLQ